MAGNNSIKILRGDNVKTNSTIRNQVLLEGQPLYDLTTNYLYIGKNESISLTNAINSNYANSAGRVTNSINFVGGGTNTRWNGSSSETVYAPTTIGSEGYVWGVTSSGDVGWIAQTAIPGTIENANHANIADIANYANIANIANSVSGNNVIGTVNSANYASNLTDGEKSNIDLSFNADNTFGIVSNEINISTRDVYQSLKINGYGTQIVGMCSISINAGFGMTIASGMVMCVSTNLLNINVGQQTSDGTINILANGDNSAINLTANSISFSTMPTVDGEPINNVANRVSNNLCFNGTYANGITYSSSWNGNASYSIYVPTAIGNTNQIWGMVNSTDVGWVTPPTNYVHHVTFGYYTGLAVTDWFSVRVTTNNNTLIKDINTFLGILTQYNGMSINIPDDFFPSTDIAYNVVLPCDFYFSAKADGTVDTYSYVFFAYGHNDTHGRSASIAAVNTLSANGNTVQQSLTIDNLSIIRDVITT